MNLWIVLLRRKDGHPWDGAIPKVVDAPTADAAVRLAFDPPPSSLHVHDAYVARLVSMDDTYSVPIDVPKPKWKSARQARPAARAS